MSPLAGLTRLQTLNLDSTGVTDLSALVGLTRLESLGLYDCGPVPTDLLRHLAFQTQLVYLRASKAAGLPVEVLSHDFFDGCVTRLRAYFAELDRGAEQENEVKVILLGNSRVGKTQLCLRFRGRPFDESVESTHGVQIWRKELKILTDDEEQAFQVNWWDFGGQDIYHSTHSLFLRSHAVFVILWTPTRENRDEHEENGIPLRNQPLAYWLDYVHSLAGSDSPVIVVQSQCDRFSDRRPAPAESANFNFFQTCAYSAKEDLGRETLEGQLRDAMRYLLERSGALSIGQGRAKLRRRLYALRSEDQERQPKERQYRTLTLAEFQVLCNEAGGSVSWEHALDYFHHTGVLFYEKHLFSSGIILDQNWALEAVYTVFDRSRVTPWLRDSGRFTREDLVHLAWEKHSKEEQVLFLSFMKSCGVCFPCGKAAKGEQRFVAPDLLPIFDKARVKLYAWRDEPGIPTLRLEYRFFHQAVIRNLMSALGSQAGDLAEYWKYGLWLKDDQRDAQLLIQFESNATAKRPAAGALVLKAQGRDPLGLLREVRKVIFRQRIVEQPEELLTLGNTTVSRSALEGVIDGRVLDSHKRPVSAARFAAFFEGREVDPAGEQEKGEAALISPVPLTASEKPRELFISYAWEDDSPEGKARGQAVDALQAALKSDGFEPIRDRDAIRPGDQISAFMLRLTRADLVVAVISDKYLRSPNCMFEIYKLWQKYQGDAAELAKRVVPIMMPGVKLASVKDRLPYMEYWSDQADKLEPLIRNPKLHPSSESWEEVRLVREFALHADAILRFLNDILMPRQLEAHLDNGFEAVRDALRRRLAST